jgi:hypothetical protein
MQTARNMQIMGNRLPTYGEAMTLAQMPPSGFIAEARALAAKHASQATTRPQGGFTQDQKDIYAMTGIRRASRSW